MVYRGMLLEGATYLNVVGLWNARVLVVGKVDVALGNALANLGECVGKLVIDVLFHGRSDLQGGSRTVSDETALNVGYS